MLWCVCVNSSVNCMYFTTPAFVPGCVISLMALCNNTGRVTSVTSIGNCRDSGKEPVMDTVRFDKSPLTKHCEAVVIVNTHAKKHIIFQNIFSWEMTKTKLLLGLCTVFVLLISESMGCCIKKVTWQWAEEKSFTSVTFILCSFSELFPWNRCRSIRAAKTSNTELTEQKGYKPWTLTFFTWQLTQTCVNLLLLPFKVACKYFIS